VFGSTVADDGDRDETAEHLQTAVDQETSFHLSNGFTMSENTVEVHGLLGSLLLLMHFVDLSIVYWLTSMFWKLLYCQSRKQ